MGIMFSNNPNDFVALDGVYIDERTPPGRVNGVNTGIVGVIGEFERGPEDASGNPVVATVASAQDLFAQFGGAGALNQYLGFLGLLNKKFGTLRIRRVIPTGSARASKQLVDGAAANVIRVDANSKGAWGGNITVAVAAGTNASTKKITIVYTCANPVFTDTEVFDNIPQSPASQAALNAALPHATGNGVGASKYVNFVWLVAGTGLANLAATALTGGADGTAVAGDYTAALTDYDAQAQQDISFLCMSNPPDTLRVTINTSMVTGAQANPGRVYIIAGLSTDSKAAAITAKTALTQYQNLFYTFNHPKTVLADGTVVTTGPETWLASVRSQLLPEQSSSDPDTTAMLGGISDLTYTSLTRQDYIDLRAAGICAVAPYDADIGGYHFMSSVNTYYPTAFTKGTDEGMQERRTLASFLEMSIAKRLKAQQNKPLPLNPDGTLSADHYSAAGEIGAFLGDLKRQNRIGDFLLDLNSGNTPQGLAAGQFIIVMKVKRNPNADFIVLRSTVSTGVTVAQ
jgi:hypothetical protein